MIDTHCHLTEGRLANQIGDVLERAEKVGISRVIVPSTSLEDAKTVLEIVNKYENVYGMVGVHPEEVARDGSPREYSRDDTINLVKSSEKIVGIGEIGLDFYYDREKKTKDQQIKLFKMQMELAVEMNKPVAIHCREASAEMKKVLEEMGGLPRGQLHCFGEGVEFLEYVLEEGFYVSFCGNVTYKSAGNLRDLLKRVPMDRLLLETDSPYLAPEGYRNKPNEPANVKIIAEYIAKILDINLETLINQTTENAKCLYFGG